MSGKTFHTSSVVFDGTRLFEDAARSLSKPNPQALAACLENARTFGCAYPLAVERSMADVLERALDLRPVVSPLYEVVLRRYPDIRPLEAGWELRRSSSRPDQFYYAHEASGRTTWERPHGKTPSRRQHRRRNQKRKRPSS